MWVVISVAEPKIIFFFGSAEPQIRMAASAPNTFY
jgi:hypothetical protein